MVETSGEHEYSLNFHFDHGIQTAIGGDGALSKIETTGLLTVDKTLAALERAKARKADIIGLGIAGDLLSSIVYLPATIVGVR